MENGGVVSLREYIEALLDQMDKRYQQRFEDQTRALDAAFNSAREAVQTALTAAEKAVLKAEMAADKRFESVNEFRQTLSDQAGTFVNRDAFDANSKVQSQRISEISARLDRMEGKSAGFSSGWAILIGAIGAIGVLVAIIVRM